MRVMAKIISGLMGAIIGAGVVMLIRWASGLPFWEPGQVMVAAVVFGIFFYLARLLGIRQLFSLGAVRASGLGIIGVGVTAGIVILIRYLVRLTPWDPGPVMVPSIMVGVVTYMASIGVFRHWFRWATGIGDADDPDAPEEKGWKRYFSYSTSHKVIGMQYFITGLVFLPYAISLQIAARVHMAKLGTDFLTNTTYEWVISDHGIIMLFFVVLPVFSGLMNYFIPLLIGSREVAFPRLNAFTFWLIPAGGLLASLSLIAGGFDTGWTTYPPLSSQFENFGMDMVFLGVYIGGLSSILTAVNIITTIVKMRAPGMHYFRMPIFVWSTLATVALSLTFTQFIAMSFIMVILQRTLGMGFFNPAMGGQALLYQWLFWFYSHPAVYVFVLIGLGLISDIIPVFVRKPLFGYRGVAISSPGIAVGGSLVFAHHMFAAGMPGFLRVPFMFTTLLVAVPTGVKVFAWVATTWMGKLRLTTAFLFVSSAAIVFLIGGLTGIPLGIVPIDLYLHATYWVVGHFHAMLFGGFLLPVMGGIYYWYPKVTGRMLSESWGKIQWALMTLGMFLLFIPMLGLGIEGMRRRVADYTLGLGFQQMHIANMIGGFLVLVGFIILVYNIVISFKHGEAAGPNPWRSRTLEWHTSSPPPENNFATIPTVIDNPFAYGSTYEGSGHAIFDHDKEGD